MQSNTARKSYWSEGEKDCNALIVAGFAATTAGGAGHVPAEAADLLRGANIKCILDNDRAGREAAAKLNEVLGATTSRLRFYLPAQGKDAHDHLVTHGLTVDDFVPFLGVEARSRLLATPPSVPFGGSTAAPERNDADFANRVLVDKVAELGSTPEGRRNIVLNGTAYYLDRLAHGGVYDHSEMHRQLEETALRIGLDPREIRDTLRSADRAAATQPRAFTTAWRSNQGDDLILAVERAVSRTPWKGKGSMYRLRVLLGTIEVLKAHHFAPDDFPASERDIQAQCGAKHRPSLRSALAALVKDGWLEVVRKGRREGTATRWRLQTPASVVSECPPTSCFPGVSPGSYSRSLPISHAAFLQSCLGISAHRLLLHLSVDEPITTGELSRRAHLSPSTTRRALRRLDESGIVTFKGGWKLTKRHITALADRAARTCGSDLEQLRFQRRLEAQKRSYRDFRRWLHRTPPWERRRSTIRTNVVLILQAA